MLLPSPEIKIKGVTRRLHSRRIAMIITPDGHYQVHFKKLLTAVEVAKMRANGHRDTLINQIIRDRIWYTVVTFSHEAWLAIAECQAQLGGPQRRKRNF